jgi:hypothetical protein
MESDLARGDQPQDPIARAADLRQLESHIADAVYYLRHSCEPCAERHFDRARRHGASEEQIEAARLRARGPEEDDGV